MKKTWRGHGPPFDSGDGIFTNTATAKSFPFERVAEDSILLKSVPIELCWTRNRRSRSVDSPEKLQRAKAFGTEDGGQFWNSTWFRLPPKVRSVPGILGSHPLQGTRGEDLGGGEC